MADPFAAALATLHVGPCAVAAVYAPKAGGSADIRIIIGLPDAVSPFADAQVVRPTVRLQFRKADIASPQPGDHVTAAGKTYRLLGDAEGDAEGLTWNCGAVAE